MSRLALLAAVTVVACSSGPRPITGSSSTPARYTLQPVAKYSGTLELAVDRATLKLQSSADQSQLALDGFSRWENGKLLITVRQDDTSVTLTCDAKGSTLDCAYDDEYTLFGSVSRPQRVVFDKG